MNKAVTFKSCVLLAGKSVASAEGSIPMNLGIMFNVFISSLPKMHTK